MLKPNRLDDFLYRSRIFFNKHATAFSSYLIGFITALLFETFIPLATASASLPTIALAIVQNNYIWFGAALFLVFLLIRRGLTYHHQIRGYDVLFGKTLHARVDPLIRPFAQSQLAYGTSLPLIIAPSIDVGWPIQDIKVVLLNDAFTLPKNFEEGYQTFFRQNQQHDHLFADNIKYMLTKNPSSFSDDAQLTLEFKKTKFSEVSFYRQTISLISSRWKHYIENTMNTHEITFPNSFCLHAIIRTADHKYLITKRSSKVSYYPNSWSVSLEEQLAEADFLPDKQEVLVKTAVRMMHEELGIGKEEVNLENARCRAVILEGDILNCALIAEIPLLLTSTELDNILRSRVRDDYEFSEHKYWDINTLASKLRENREHFHPTSGIRILLTLAAHKGPKAMAETFLTA